jgi:pimeloyl-ACP methyl ester carboxylesterase
VDGSGWGGVYDTLTKKGYNVSVVQESETSFQADVTATKRILAQQNGSCILVGHSYGGSVITEAGNDPVVVGLVHIAAHMPDKGESEAGDGKLFPSELSKSGAIKVTPDGYTYLDPAKFPYYFAPGFPPDRPVHGTLAGLNPATSFATKIIKAAWRTKRWMLVAGATASSIRTSSAGMPSVPNAENRGRQGPATRSCLPAQAGRRAHRGSRHEREIKSAEPCKLSNPP